MAIIAIVSRFHPKADLERAKQKWRCPRFTKCDVHVLDTKQDHRIYKEAGITPYSDFETWLYTLDRMTRDGRCTVYFANTEDHRKLNICFLPEHKGADVPIKFGEQEKKMYAEICEFAEYPKPIPPTIHRPEIKMYDGKDGRGALIHPQSMIYFCQRQPSYSFVDTILHNVLEMAHMTNTIDIILFAILYVPYKSDRIVDHKMSDMTQGLMNLVGGDCEDFTAFMIAMFFGLRAYFQSSARGGHKNTRRFRRERRDEARKFFLSHEPAAAVMYNTITFERKKMPFLHAVCILTPTPGNGGVSYYLDPMYSIHPRIAESKARLKKEGAYFLDGNVDAEKDYYGVVSVNVHDRPFFKKSVVRVFLLQFQDGRVYSGTEKSSPLAILQNLKQCISDPVQLKQFRDAFTEEERTMIGDTYLSICKPCLEYNTYCALQSALTFNNISALPDKDADPRKPLYINHQKHPSVTQLPNTPCNIPVLI